MRWTCSTPTSVAWTFFARGLLAAQAIIDDGRIDEFKAQRYAGWDTGFGKSMLDGNETLESMEAKSPGAGRAQARLGPPGDAGEYPGQHDLEMSPTALSILPS